ncbi:MAG: hypothetical protein AB1331_05370 [Bacillota bacterium]
MIEIDVAGILFTALILGPMLLPELLAAMIVLEVGRLFGGLVFGTAATAMTMGGAFGHLGGVDTVSPLAELTGPVLCFVLGQVVVTWRATPDYRRLLEPWTRPSRPFGAALLRLAILAGLVAAWRLGARL